MCNCQERAGAEPGAPGAAAVPGAVPPVVPPEVPLAQPVTLEEGGSDIPPDNGPVFEPGPGRGHIPPPFKLCRSVFRGGCYALTFRPSASLVSFEGTLRVDRSAPDGGPDNIIVSGDLYRRPLVLPPLPIPHPLPTTPGSAAPAEPDEAHGRPVSVAATASRPGAELLRRRIPIFPRSRYHSYLKVTSVSTPIAVPPGRPCTVTLVVEQFDYTHPPAGSFKGSFPANPSRTVTLKLSQVGVPPPFAGSNFEGRWIEGGVDKGAVTLSWVSSFFRRATVEIDTLAGAIPPEPVPDGAGGMAYFDSIYAKHGWQLTVIRDQVNVPVPAGVNPTECWSSGNLHNLMAAIRNPATNVDTDWRIHLVVVPAKLGCGRGVMYDQIDVPREGCASFSHDGYPDSDSSNFGQAENKRQHEVGRAYLRSATHEITHTFNQIHQEQETSSDNSIMTTTPSVADVLGGPNTGDPGVFPDQINLAVNTTVRHHLVHMPDPVIRPGGWPFASWFGTAVPQASDRHQFDPSELELTLTGPAGRVVFGQPVELTWTLTNRSGETLILPNDVSLEGQFASMMIIDANGKTRPFRPFVIRCEHVRLAELEPGASVTAAHRVYWSSDGFAFPNPGNYRVRVAVTWSAQGVPVGVQDETELFVEFPTSDQDNDAAGLVLNPEVGKWVALGGDAYHLTEATRRLSELSDRAATDREPRLLAGFRGLLPDADRADGGGDRPGGRRPEH